MTKDIFKFLNKAQKEAVDTIDGPVLVIAGPGTGKTQLLALRAANILDKTDVLPQNILCLTYTESAARNMRDRLSQFIGKQAYDVRMSTYHGFGSEIIRNYREFFTEENADTPIDAIGQNQIMHQIYDELPASNVLWRKEVYLKDALNFISEAKRALLSPDDIRLIANDNLRAVKKVNKLSKKHLKNLVKIDKTAAPMFESLFIDMQNNQSASVLPNKILPLDNMATTALAEALIANRETGKTNTITAFKNEWFTKDAQDEWVLKGTKEATKLLAAADIYEQYLAKLKKAKLFDYDDMILRAINAIKQNDELRFTLQEQFQYIMLDEFQDTNLAQLELIELLTNNPASEGRPNVMAVGDDDQAIFSFQGADLTNMIRFHNMYKDIKTITLTENWRSHADILTTSEYVSGQIDDRLHSRLGVAEKLLVAKNPNLPSSSNVQRREFLSDLAEIDWVAKEIAKAIENSTEPSEIAVIAPKHKYLEPLVPFLQASGVPIRYDKRENVFEDPNILDLINSAKLVIALQNGDQQLANSLWPSVLSGAEWQVPTSTIWQISWQSNKNRYTDADSDWQSLMMQDDTLKPIALFFSKLAQIASTETLETMLDYIVGISALELNEQDIKEYLSPYFEYHFGKERQQLKPVLFNQLLSNLTVLRQKLRGYKTDNDSALKITDLLEFVETYHNADEKLLNTSPYHASQNAVQLLTAYSAKGLEFETVFVLAALDDVWGMKARGGNNLITLPHNLKIIRAAGKSKDEKKRLFYVALTRAKHSLYLTSFKQNYAGKQSSSLEFLDESTDGGQSISKALPSGQNQVVSSNEDPPSIETIQRFWQTRHIEDATQPKLKEIIMPRLENFQLSATHLNNFTDLVYGGPQSFLINTILKFPKSPSADGQFGNAMHETLDFIHIYLKTHQVIPEPEQINDTFAKNLKKKKLSDNDYKRLLSRGKEAFKLFMPQWWPNFSPTNESELSFKDEGVLVGDAHLTGNLDHLLIDHANQSIIVADFKTGKGKDKWTKEVKMHKYKQQLLFYKLLLEGSHSYKKYTTEQGKLVFVEPNEDGDIIELSLEYNTQDIERTKALINAVWHRIKSLDFPDTSEFTQDYKGIIEFEDWLIAND